MRWNAAPRRGSRQLVQSCGPGRACARSIRPPAFYKRAMDSEEHWSDPVAHLRQAFAQDAFTLYCQPIGALGATMSYPMAEVLVRLHEEEKAMRPPGEFLPLLEHYGMMPELDRWVVRHVLRRLAAGCRIPS